MLKDVFIELCSRFSGDTNSIGRSWNHIAQSYSGRNRHYHNLDHLSRMLTHLESCRHLVDNWENILFALFYHDIVYQPAAKDNEEKSAVEAEKSLAALGVPADRIERITHLILATKSHKVSTDHDVNLFTDADLAILGSSEAEYEQYRAAVRKEYSIYPGVLYNTGRGKVLQHFLDMQSIFKTDFFRSRLEAQARENIRRELKTL